MHYFFYSLKQESMQAPTTRLLALQSDKYIIKFNTLYVSQQIPLECITAEI